MREARKPLILIVEDDFEWQDLLRKEFGSGYLLKIAFSRYEAENSLDVLLDLGYPPAVCVLDPTIPESPSLIETKAVYQVGEEFAGRLKRHAIPFTILTGRPGSASRVIDAFENLGASGIFLKHEWPQNKERFFNRVRQLADRPHPKEKETELEPAFGSALWPFFLALVGFPLVIFVLLIAVVQFTPEGILPAVLGLGIILVIILIASFALFINKLTGKQFVDVIKELLELLKRK